MQGRMVCARYKHVQEKAQWRQMHVSVKCQGSNSFVKILQHVCRTLATPHNESVKRKESEAEKAVQRVVPTTAG